MTMSEDSYKQFVADYRHTFKMYVDTAIHNRNSVWDEKVFYSENEQQALLNRFDKATEYHSILAKWNIQLRVLKRNIYQELYAKGYLANKK